MEAKDTVIKPEETLLTGQRLLEVQAEISFKAGIREVVEWLNTRHKEPKYIFWQAKLKEWGVENG